MSTLKVKPLSGLRPISSISKAPLPRPFFPTTITTQSFRRPTPTMASTTDRRSAELDKMFKNAGSLVSPKILLDNSRRVSEKLAARMLDQIGLTRETSTPFKLLDNACGIGATSFEIHRRIKPEVLEKSSILLGDFTEGVLGMTEQVARNEGWLNTTVQRVDGQNTGLPSGEFTHVTTNIGFHVIPDSKAALDEALRILAPGGILGFTTFHQIPGWAQEVQSAFASFPFEAPFSFSVQTTPYGDWGNVNWVRQELTGRLGLEDVNVDVYAFLSRIDGPDYFLEYYGAMVDWIVRCNWSEELQGKVGREEYRRLLREYLEVKYRGEGWDVSWVGVVASGRVPRGD